MRTERVQEGDYETLQKAHDWMEAEFPTREDAVRCSGMPLYPTFDRMKHLLDSGYPTFVRWEGENEDECVAYLVLSMDGMRPLWARQREVDAPLGSALHTERMAGGMLDGYVATGNWIDWTSLGITHPVWIQITEEARALAEQFIADSEGG